MTRDRSASCSSPVRTASTTSRGRSNGSAARRSCAGTATRRVHDADAVVIPGGFAHGDYLRTGAIARFSPVMDAVREFAAQRRAGRRRVQRLPGADRGRDAARRAAEERGAEVPLRDGRAAGRDRHDRAHEPGRAGRAPAGADQPLRGQLRVRRADARAAAGRRPRRRALRRQPERQPRRHRRASATRAATSSGSCRTPSGRATPCSARPTVSCCSSRCSHAAGARLVGTTPPESKSPMRSYRSSAAGDAGALQDVGRHAELAECGVRDRLAARVALADLHERLLERADVAPPACMPASSTSRSRRRWISSSLPGRRPT